MITEPELRDSPEDVAIYPLGDTGTLPFTRYQILEDQKKNKEKEKFSLVIFLPNTPPF